MPFTCSQCGATYTGEETCEDRFNVSQLKELEMPSYYAVHHLSVPCYMLQHNVYSREGWLAVRDLLFQFVHRGLTPQMARRQYSQRGNSTRRKFSITRGAKLPGVEDIDWTRTIAGVRLATAELYCADVREWAKSILLDSQKLVQANTGPT